MLIEWSKISSLWDICFIQQSSETDPKPDTSDNAEIHMIRVYLVGALWEGLRVGLNSLERNEEWDRSSSKTNISQKARPGLALATVLQGSAAAWPRKCFPFFNPNKSIRIWSKRAANVFPFFNYLNQLLQLKCMELPGSA